MITFRYPRIKLSLIILSIFIPFIISCNEDSGVSALLDTNNPYKINTTTSHDITISIDDVSVLETNDCETADLIFTVTISEEPDEGEDITVDWSTADSTAKTGNCDYSANSGSLTFTNSGSTTQTISVSINGDNTVEPDETLYVNLSNAHNAIINDSQSIGTIEDDEVCKRVDPTASGTEDGDSWSTAYDTIQEAVAIVAAAGGGEVWVAANTYTNGGGTGTVIAMESNVDIYGGFEGYNSGSGFSETLRSQCDYKVNITIIDGNNSAYHVVTGADNAIIDGFTITNGNANASSPDNNGSGIYNDSSSPDVVNCIISNNSASLFGGGAYNINSSPTFTNCIFTNNKGNSGGGITNTSSTLILTNCIVSENIATLGGNGGGVYNGSSSNLTMTNCTLTGNIGDNGDGLYNNSSVSTLTNCIMWGNYDSEIYVVSGTCTVNYSNIEGDYTGTGNINTPPDFFNIPLQKGETTYSNTTNRFSHSDSATYSIDDIIEIDNDGILRTVTNVSGNTVYFTPELLTAVLKVKYVDKWGSVTTSADIDLHINNNSPCIDAGDNSVVTVATDFDGNDRLIDNPSVIDSGNGTAPIVDMGAYEYQ